MCFPMTYVYFIYLSFFLTDFFSLYKYVWSVALDAIFNIYEFFVDAQIGN